MNLSSFSVLLGCGVALFIPLQGSSAESRSTIIITPQEPSWAEALAAREVRRYLHLRTGYLVPIASENDTASKGKNALVIARKDRRALDRFSGTRATINSLQPQNYWLKTLPAGESGAGTHTLLLIGGDDAGVLYAAYRFAEILGVRFYLHGDVVPEQDTLKTWPVLDERSKPLFALRGIQPFHDFPEGPDWWNRDDYLATIGQLAKLRMNFIGLHTYPEDRPNAEPTAWIGRPDDAGQNGAVTFSYPSSYQNTLRGNWGYTPKKTSDFLFGSAELFERDDYGAGVMEGFIPQPSTPEACNELFERTAKMLHESFSFAHKLGVKTCVGTETPLVVPKLVQQRLKNAGANPADLAITQQLYTGIFRRAALAYPLDYYWFWTPEDWTWSGTKDATVTATTNDLFAAIAAHKQVAPPFALATCGWVLGPQQDRAMFDKVLPKNIPVSCINREVGKTPVEPGFADVHGRSKWAIPWMEDDPALTSPQLWVGRMRRDAADALRYGCDGLMGIHWRTRVLGPNIGALAQAAWKQQPWVASYKPERPPASEARQPGPVGGTSAAFPNNPITGTEEPALYQTVRYNLSAYHLRASNGTCRVTLKFSEPHYAEAGKRVFDVKLQGRTVITNLDIFASVGRNKALDFSFANVAVTNGWVDIEFIPRVEFPSIAAIAIEGSGFSTRVNCGGPAWRDYAADAPSATPVTQVYADTGDFYLDWAAHEFGKETGPKAADIFSRIDCKLPVPSVWTDGPGGIQPDARAWEEVRMQYAFVDEFASLKRRVQGAGNLERYDYWLNTFLYLRDIGELSCAWGEYNRAIEKVKAEKDRASQSELARKEALPQRLRIVFLLRRLFDHLLATVSTPGELGTVANWNQHNVPALLTRPGEELAKLLGEDLPPGAQPDLQYRGPTRVIVPSKRTSIGSGETLKLKVLILSEQPARDAALFWRSLGAGKFSSVPLHHVSRGVYEVDLPPAANDFEYYIRVQPEKAPVVFHPATAPKLNQTVVLYSRY